jgi:hypothetical protein
MIMAVKKVSKKEGGRRIEKPKKEKEKGNLVAHKK